MKTVLINFFPISFLKTQMGDSDNDIFNSEQQQEIVDSIDLVHIRDCFYSDYVIELITKVFIYDQDQRQYDRIQYDVINSDLTLNLDVIDGLLDQLLSEKDVSYDVKAIDEMKYYLEKIAPLMKYVHYQFEKFIQFDTNAQKLISILEPNLFWTGNWKQYFIDSIEIALNWQKDLFNNCKLSLEEETTTRNIIALYIITRYTFDHLLFIFHINFFSAVLSKLLEI